MLDTTFSESMNNMVTSDPLENTETSTINAKIKYFLKERPIPFYSGFKIETTTQGRCALFAKYSVAV